MAAIISNNTQGSTEATQLANKADLDSIVTNTTGLATQATLSAAKTDLDQIVTNTTGLSNPTSSFIHSDTISTVAVGATQDAGTGNLVKTYSIVSKGTGAAPTLLSCNLEVSLDSTNWTILQTITQASDGQINSSGSTLFPARYFRCNVTSITLGGASNVVVTIAAMK